MESITGERITSPHIPKRLRNLTIILFMLVNFLAFILLIRWRISHISNLTLKSTGVKL